MFHCSLERSNPIFRRYILKFRNVKGQKVCCGLLAIITCTLDTYKNYFSYSFPMLKIHILSPCNGIMQS